jgi:hypothetical protein
VTSSIVAGAVETAHSAGAVEAAVEQPDLVVTAATEVLLRLTEAVAVVVLMVAALAARQSATPEATEVLDQQEQPVALVAHPDRLAHLALRGQGREAAALINGALERAPKAFSLTTALVLITARSLDPVVARAALVTTAAPT